MTLVQAIILGIVQGLTEFLPISSTAHLRIVPALAGWPDPGAAFTAVIQLGTLLAVLVYFQKDIVRLTISTCRCLFRGKPFAEAEACLAWKIVLGTLPIVICGLAFKSFIETELRSLYVIAVALLVLAMLMVAAEELVKLRRRSRTAEREIDQVSWGDGLLIGCCQALALIPGTSRSGVTIVGALFLGLSRSAAARFSFLLSLPAVFAAAVLELYDQRDALLASRDDAANLITATAVSAIVGYAAIAFLLRFLRYYSLHVFIGYRLLLGGWLLYLLGTETLSPWEGIER